MLSGQQELRTRLWELLQSIDRPICRMSHQLDSLEDQINRIVIRLSLETMLTDFYRSFRFGARKDTRMVILSTI